MLTKFRELIFYGNDSDITNALYKDFLLNEENVFVFSDTEPTLNLEIPIRPLEELANTTALNEKSIYVLTSCTTALRDALLRCVPLDAKISATGLDSHSSRTPLVLISPPKAGSHLLITLVGSFGYQAGRILPFNPLGGHWYTLDYDSIHTSAQDYFFYRNNRGNNYGGRLEAFERCLGVAMYRHPRDIIKSRLNYNFDPQNAVMGRYMEGATRRAQCESLLDENSVFRDIGRELADFTNWAKFPNVIPIAYEEFCSQEPEDTSPLDIVWELQLHLQIGGRPNVYLEKSLGNSPTFSTGQVFAPDEDVDALSDVLTKKCRYYMDALGYESSSPYSDYFRKARQRVFSTQDNRPVDLPIRIENTNLFAIYYQDKAFYAACLSKEGTDFLQSLGVDMPYTLQSENLEDLLFKVRMIETGQKFPVPANFKP